MKNEVIREVLVEEWYLKRGGKVYLNWEFQDGRRMVRLTPYDDVPYVTFDVSKLNEARHGDNLIKRRGKKTREANESGGGSRSRKR